MNFEDLLTPKPYRWPKRGDLPFQKAKSAEAAGTLAPDGFSRAVFIMDGGNPFDSLRPDTSREPVCGKRGLTKPCT